MVPEAILKTSEYPICPAAPVTATLIGEVMQSFSRGFSFCHPESGSCRIEGSRGVSLKLLHRNPSTPLRCAQVDESCARPLFSSSSLINLIFRRTLWLSRTCEIVFGKRRVQFVVSAVPGTLNRSFRARRSVIMTMTIHALL